MARELDVREFGRSRVSPDRAEALHSAASAVSRSLPAGGRVRIETFDGTTGNPAVTWAEGMPAERGDYVRRALEHVHAISSVLGLSRQASEFIADPTPHETSSGATAVHVQQRYKGIPVFQAATTVRFAPDGSIWGTAGSTITIEDDVPVEPTLTVQQAVLAAARHVAEPQEDEERAVAEPGAPPPPAGADVSDFEPVVRTMFADIPEQPTVLEPGPFAADIKGSLVWFPRQGRTVLGWSVYLTMPDEQARYHAVVDAISGEILYCEQLVRHVAAVGNVFLKDPSSGRTLVSFPRNINDYGLPFPAQGQNGWRYCSKCKGLFFGVAAPSVCPKDLQAHDPSLSGDYHLVVGSPAYPGQGGWQRCKKCQALFFSGGASKCPAPAGSAHDGSGSGDYRLLLSDFAPGQPGWRWCSKCQGMFFSAGGASACPGTGTHNGATSGDYRLFNFPSGLPDGFPDPWVLNNATFGNCTNARYQDSASGTPVYGTTPPNQPLTFDPHPDSKEQRVLNLFYYACAMHDYFYLLGFREADGNFQEENFNRGGSAAKDRVQGRVHPGPVQGLASMAVASDTVTPGPMMTTGVSPVSRHTALDSSIIFHEFTHGLTFRLVGGPTNVTSLSAPQSQGLGEGWSDYVACTLNDSTVVGAWVMNDPTGLRRHLYDDQYPDRFGQLGTGPDFTGNPPHNVGEIWAATLLELNRKTDKNLIMQVMVDSLKLVQANPSFLNARDAMLLAVEFMYSAGRLTTAQRDGLWLVLWKVFSKYGMGPEAASNGAQLSGIVQDTTLGEDGWFRCGQCRALYWAGPVSKCPKSGAGHSPADAKNYDLVLNMAGAPGDTSWRWCQVCGVLFSSGAASKCAIAGAPPHNAWSGTYTVVANIAGTAPDTTWRRCSICRGLVSVASAGSGVECPGGGLHSVGSTTKYALVHQ